MLDNEESQYLENTVHLPCPSCGSRLHYSAKTKKITCDYCGYLEDVNEANDQVVERSLHDAVSDVLNFVPEEKGKRVFDCQNCGSKFMVDSEQVRITCSFCGSNNVNVEAYDHQFVEPVGIIPFYVSRAEADKIFMKWIRRGWFHPSKMKRLAEVEQLHGLYLPFWTFDAHTESDWEGEAGYYYYETVTVRVNGKMQTKQVQKVRWEYRSGHLTHFFDDILVAASGGLDQKHVERILPYRLSEVVNFDPRLMIGWEAEIYNIEVNDGYQIGDSIMDHKIRNMCSAQLGGDTQRNLHIQSHKSEQTFKHIVLPVWMCSYLYNNKVYHFTINGQTGKVYGKKPLSWAKIAFLIFLFVLFIFGVWLLRESGVLAQ